MEHLPGRVVSIGTEEAGRAIAASRIELVDAWTYFHQ
jgi:hypothetical protein